uniref:Protein TRANSPARENT TESTA 12 n=1 Tax=Aegilops tauschii subsp. strangulata TaxID=200361 RepID=A0A452ZNE3_AEGTS
MPILAMSVVFDGLQCVLSGVVRGCGQQKMAAFGNLGAYYLVGIPAAFFFAFVFHLGGMVVPLSLCFIFLFYSINKRCKTISSSGSGSGAVVRDMVRAGGADALAPRHFRVRDRLGQRGGEGKGQSLHFFAASRYDDVRSSKH